ncbi:MAG: hypothetical protein VYE02_12635 [Verrucomicrobiota bacterium]|nr:hypothetical protein [Verrucomicrobiota bacterium]
MHPDSLRSFVLAFLCHVLLLSVWADPLKTRLTQSPHQLVYEAYIDDNWEIMTSHADGSQVRNLTRSKDRHELYPQVSPDGTKLCFVSDQGAGRDTVRSVHIMNMDGSGHQVIADHARQPCWTHDSDTLIYLPQEYPKWNVVDYYTKGLMYYHLPTKKHRPHPNTEKLHHLYNPSMSSDGHWIVATVHAGMGFKHAILLIEAEGERIIDLKVPGCRPTFSPDGTKVAWGPGDHEIAIGRIDWKANPPKVAEKLLSVKDAVHKIYHVDWAPDGRFLSISRGLSSDGDPSKPGTHQAACEMVGIYAEDWNIIAVATDASKTIDLAKEENGLWTTLTRDGRSYKESDWFTPSR